MPLNSARRVAVFCHYDANGELKTCTERYIEQIAASGLATIFVTSAPEIRPDFVERLRPHCGLIIHRQNIGYDFGCYREGIAAVENLRALDTLLVVNDSVYGPFSALSPLIEACSSDADFWGLTESQQHTHHIQSYFMIFRHRALAHPAFEAFWRDYPFSNFKPAVVRSGELALSKRLRKAGLRMRALFPMEELRRKFLQRCASQDIRPERHRAGTAIGDEQILYWTLNGVDLNPTHYYWRDLLDLGFPFIKRELLDRNPENVAGVNNWRAHLPPDMSVEQIDKRDKWSFHT